MNKKFEKLGFYPANILMPKGQDMHKWAVVACDQFTSEPEYWASAEEIASWAYFLTVENSFCTGQCIVVDGGRVHQFPFYLAGLLEMNIYDNFGH